MTITNVQIGESALLSHDVSSLFGRFVNCDQCGAVRTWRAPRRWCWLNASKGRWHDVTGRNFQPGYTAEFLIDAKFDADVLQLDIFSVLMRASLYCRLHFRLIDD